MEAIDFFWMIGALVLVVSALAAHRFSARIVLRGFLGWAAIVAVAWLLVSYRGELRNLADHVADRLGAGDQRVEGKTVRIAMGSDGHFTARVQINGFARRMLVDSGATFTALTPETARRADIDVPAGGFPVLLDTANGRIAAQRAVAHRVSVGSLHIQDLPVVVSPTFGDDDVLGMNFLSRLGSWRVEGRTLVLEPKTD